MKELTFVNQITFAIYSRNRHIWKGWAYEWKDDLWTCYNIPIPIETRRKICENIKT